MVGEIGLVNVTARSIGEQKRRIHVHRITASRELSTKMGILILIKVDRVICVTARISLKQVSWLPILQGIGFFVYLPEKAAILKKMWAKQSRTNS